MSTFDLVLRGGSVVTSDGVRHVDIGIADGKIAALAPDLPGGGQAELDAVGLHIFPGLIDAHVHFNEPGRGDWEGIATGSRALAVGGGTIFFDMPLNAHPPTCDGASFDLKLAAALKQSVTDFAFWGGLVPQNLDRLEELAKRGVIGFKAFMSDSGIDDFARADNRTLRAGMKQAAALKLPVAVHAESETLTKKLAAEKIAAGKISIRDYLESRPVQAELEAIRRALELAGETGCALHIVHVSSGEGIALVSVAKSAGVNVTCETCPHYLTLTGEDVERIGAPAKCAPPLRASEIKDALWQKLLGGEIDTVGSDHSPSLPEMKTGDNFFKVWGGISGVQHTLPLLFDGIAKRGLLPAQIARVTSFNVAERFRLPKTKGRMVVGADADLAVVDLTQPIIVRAEDLLYRHPQSPYVGRTLTGQVVQTILRGKTISKNGRIMSTDCGQLIKPV
ncbi:MAG TPA: allantoinase AllB [Verrucomicrobiae bacterium]|nr:allantoinase AllB [Verrucomicrobiae bacterium]